jgi:hypothetical protein
MLQEPLRYIRLFASESGVDTGTFVNFLTQLRNDDNNALKILCIEWEWQNVVAWPGSLDIVATWALFRGANQAGPQIASPGVIFGSSLVKLGTAASTTDVVVNPQGRWEPVGDFLIPDESLTLYITSTNTGLAQFLSFRITVEKVKVTAIEKVRLLKQL